MAHVLTELYFRLMFVYAVCYKKKAKFIHDMLLLRIFASQWNFLLHSLSLQIFVTNKSLNSNTRNVQFPFPYIHTENNACKMGSMLIFPSLQHDNATSQKGTITFKWLIITQGTSTTQSLRIRLSNYIATESNKSLY